MNSAMSLADAALPSVATKRGAIPTTRIPHEPSSMSGDRVKVATAPSVVG